MQNARQTSSSEKSSACCLLAVKKSANSEESSLTEVYYIRNLPIFQQLPISAQQADDFFDDDVCRAFCIPPIYRQKYMQHTHVRPYSPSLELKNISN
jgi:hypothetical protein